MSGLFAVFHRTGRPAVDTDLIAGERALAAYGSLYTRHLMCGPAGLSYAHAEHYPEAIGEQQPVLGGNGRFAMVFDGRIDNREELLVLLARDGLALDHAPDSALAMLCWERWQQAAPEHLIGDCAFIVWDQAEQRLFAARDHLGIRPLSYFADADRIVIATAPQVLFASGCVAREVDRQKLSDVLVDNYRDAGLSYFKHVRRIPPAHTLVADRHGIKLARYWSLDAGRQIRLKSDIDYAEAAQELLDKAVKCRLRSIGPVGAELSSGLDSPMVAITALKHLPEASRLPVFTLVPEEGWNARLDPDQIGDEGPGVREIVRMHPRLEPHFLSFDGLAVDAGLPDRLRTFGIVPRASLAIELWTAMHQAARDRGVKVMLNGNGGNMTLTWDGRAAYFEWLKRGNWGRLARELGCVSSNPIEFCRRLFGLAALPGLPRWMQQVYSRLRPGNTPRWGDWRGYSLINPDFARARDVDGRASETGWDFFTPTWDHRRFRIDWTVNNLANDFGDQSLGFETLNGVQNRHPLSDVRLIEWSFAIPEEQYIRDGQDRWLGKRLLAGLMPPELLENRRPAYQLSDWHKRMTRDLPRLKEQLDVMADDPDVREVLDIPAIKKMLDEWPAETPPRTDPLNYKLQLWLPHAISIARFIRHVKGANL